MPLDTYTNLKATIADTLARDDLTSQIDDFRAPRKMTRLA